MSEQQYLKCIDPARRYIWQHPKVPGIRFEYRALAGPTLDPDTARRHLNKCITAAWYVDVPDIGPVDYWTSDKGPEVDWAAVLPSDVANALFLAVASVSYLTPEEESDSPGPSGPQNSPSRTTADGAGGETGSAPDREALPPEDWPDCEYIPDPTATLVYQQGIQPLDPK